MSMDSGAVLPATIPRHEFKGRQDRWCEVCDLPDRHSIHNWTHGRDCPCTPCRQEDWDVIDITIALSDGLEYFGHEVDDVSGAVIARTPRAKKYERAMEALDRIVKHRDVLRRYVMGQTGYTPSVEHELQAVREELEAARQDLQYKERAPIDYRVTDEERYMVGLLRLQTRVRELEAEEHRLVQRLEAE